MDQRSPTATVRQGYMTRNRLAVSLLFLMNGFVTGSWAPKTVSWAPYNYAAAVRTAAETEEATRLELRLPGSDVNVHLALALMLGAGLDGLERNLPLADEPIGSGGPSGICVAASQKWAVPVRHPVRITWPDGSNALPMTFDG